jgi:hypothetical protein
MPNFFRRNRFKKSKNPNKSIKINSIFYNPYKTTPNREWEKDLISINKNENKMITDLNEFKKILDSDVNKKIRYIQFTCIDPGTVKLAFRVERRYYNDSGLLFVKECVYEMFNPKIFAEKNSMTHSDAVRKFLKSYSKLISKSHFLLVEETFKTNRTVNRICQCIIDFYCDVAESSPNFPYVVEVDDKLKGMELQVPRGKDKDDWAPERAIEILKSHGNLHSATVIPTLSKARGKTDLSDIVNIIEAFVCWKKYKCINTPRIQEIISFNKTE